jgi:hypothetical protein
MYEIAVSVSVLLQNGENGPRDHGGNAIGEQADGDRLRPRQDGGIEKDRAAEE